MIDLDKLLEAIMEYLGNIPYMELYKYKIAINKEHELLFSEQQKHRLNRVIINNTRNPVYFSPYIEGDIIIINLVDKDKEEMKVLDINDFIIHQD